ncbi:SDR family oxidoreductase [Martelella alba]|uniref:SDR family oxidoreductase n=1 Tax=Martelella alba TaxID=2590451 RepID=A0ABY2SIE9_9HYPH|nr:SDR family oxidoreductase [Martelella alba]TKI04602.1 SDR family oxidoreductase [Martelella alba]
MRVFVTGASGFIGMAVVEELLSAGHQVIGLCRSAEKAPQLAAAGAEVCRGTVEDERVLKSAVARADGVIHLAFNHDFSQFVANCAADRQVIGMLGAALAGSDRPLIITSGTAIVNMPPGQLATEDGEVMGSAQSPRAASEEAAVAAQTGGVNVSVMRLPQVHDTQRCGLITYAIEIARAKGTSAYIGDGSARWPAGHVRDVARLYRLALEKARPGAKYHAVAETGIAMRDIAAVIGRRLQLPVASITREQAEAHFGWLSGFALRDMPASGAQTQQRLGWMPTGPGLLADLEQLA